MSVTTVLAVWPWRRTEDLVEFRNSYGSAPVVWDALCRYYLGHSQRILSDDLDRLAGAFERGLMTKPSHRAMFAMTLENVYIHARNFDRAAADIRRFLIEFPIRPGFVNHWPQIATVLERRIMGIAPAIGFWFTSVSDRPFTGPWDECEDRESTFDWTKAWELYGLESPLARGS